MTDVVGGQVVNDIPTQTEHGTRHLLGTRDRWDYTVEPQERDYFRRGVGELARGNFGWLRQPLGETVSELYANPDHISRLTNRDVMSSLGQRWIMDNMLVHRQPWVTQYIDAAPQPGGGYGLTPLTGAGTRYPGAWPYVAPRQ